MIRNFFFLAKLTSTVAEINFGVSEMLFLNLFVRLFDDLSAKSLPINRRGTDKYFDDAEIRLLINHLVVF